MSFHNNINKRFRLCFLSGLTVILIYINSLHAEIYKWVDEKGRTHFSDEKPDGDSSKIDEPGVNIVSPKSVRALGDGYTCKPINTRLVLDGAIMNKNESGNMAIITWCPPRVRREENHEGHIILNYLLPNGSLTGVEAELYCDKGVYRFNSARPNFVSSEKISGTINLERREMKGALIWPEITIPFSLRVANYLEGGCP